MKSAGRGGGEGRRGEVIHLEQGLHHTTGDQRFPTGVVAGQVVEE